jgi:hypothetical protein
MHDPDTNPLSVQQFSYRGRVLPLNRLIHKDPGHVQLFGIEIARII